MLSLKTHLNFGSVLTLSLLHIKFSVCFVFILHITQLLAVSAGVPNVILPVSFHVKTNSDLIQSEISKSFDN